MKAKIPRNNSQVSEGGITVKPGKDSTHEFIIWKVDPFVPSLTCTWYQIAFQGSVNFWLQLFSIQWDENYFSGWNCYLQHSSNSRKLSWLKFHNELMCLFDHYLPKRKCRLKSTTTNGWLHFGQSEQGKLSVLFSYPIRNKSRFWLSCMWSVKDCIMPSSQKQITEMKGEGMIAG